MSEIKISDYKDKKELIINELKARGFRITSQRKLIVECILDNECSCCKEIYFKVSKIASGLGIATVYRMVKALEDIGAIDRKNLYRISCEKTQKDKFRCSSCTVVLKNKKTLELSSSEWEKIVGAGLKQMGYQVEDKVESIIIRSC